MNVPLKVLSYLMEPIVVFLVLSCLFQIVFPPPPGLLLFNITLIISLCLALLDTVRRSKTHACPRNTLCLAIYIYIYILVVGRYRR